MFEERDLVPRERRPRFSVRTIRSPVAGVFTYRMDDGLDVISGSVFGLFRELLSPFGNCFVAV